MKFRRIAETISGCVSNPLDRVKIYQVLVAEVAEPGALEQLWGIDLHLDREVVQWCRKHIPDPAIPPSTSHVVPGFVPNDGRSYPIAMESVS